MTPETPEAVLKAMLQKADEKLAVARKDFENEFFGDAVSRAYYAVYHAITAVLASRGLSFSSHTQTLGAFNREFVKNGVFPPDTYKKIQRLFEDRQAGDYDWKNQINRNTAEMDLAAATGVVTLCRKHLEV